MSKALRSNNFSVWRSLKIDTSIKSADEYRRAISAKKMHIGPYANHMLSSYDFAISANEIWISLVNVSVAEIGFKNGKNLKDIFDRIKKIGFQFCPNQVAVELRLQYTDQLKGEIIVGMKPIIDLDGDPALFKVKQIAGHYWLLSSPGASDSFYKADQHFVFVK